MRSREYRPWGKMPDEDMVRRVIASITIGEPIKSAFNPRIRYEAETYSLDIVIQTLDARGDGHHKIVVAFKERMPPFQNETAVVGYIRSMLIYVVTHELDESLYCNGKLVHDPHPDEKR